VTGRSTESTSGVATRVRQVTALPSQVASLSNEVSALRGDVSALRQDVLDLVQRLPAADASVTGQAPAADTDGQLAETPFDDGIELFAERIATLEDGLDDVAQRLEGMTRDGVQLLTTQLQALAQRVDALASRPALTAEQLEAALARVAGAPRL
jgi:outer membrane murein-binding lipoprotein Lpp